MSSRDNFSGIRYRRSGTFTAIHNAVIFVRIMPVLMAITLSLSINAGESAERGLSVNLFSSYYYDDNVTQSNVDPIDAYIFVIRPELALEWGKGASEYRLSLANEAAKFEGSSEDNYSDMFLEFTADIVLTSKHRVGVDLGIADTHQARGGGFSIGSGNLQQEVDTYSQADYGVSYRYGRDEAKAQLGFYYLVQQVDFDARFDGDGIDLTRIRDRQTDTIGATLSYEIGAKTDLVVDLNQQELDYDVESGFGNTVDSLLVGVSWDATAKTSGRIQVGTQSRDLTSGGSEDSSIWQVRLDWTPNNNSTFQMTSSKSSEASIGIGNSRDIVATYLSWILEWTSEWQSNVTYGIEETDFIGTNIDLDNTVISVNFEYEMNDMLTANIFFTDTNRDTTDVSNDFIFDQTVYGISINLSIL